VGLAVAARGGGGGGGDCRDDLACDVDFGRMLQSQRGEQGGLFVPLPSSFLLLPNNVKEEQAGGRQDDQAGGGTGNNNDSSSGGRHCHCLRLHRDWTGGVYF